MRYDNRTSTLFMYIAPPQPHTEPAAVAAKVDRTTLCVNVQFANCGFGLIEMFGVAGDGVVALGIAYDNMTRSMPPMASTLTAPPTAFVARFDHASLFENVHCLNTYDTQGAVS